MPRYNEANYSPNTGRLYEARFDVPPIPADARSLHERAEDTFKALSAASRNDLTDFIALNVAPTKSGAPYDGGPIYGVLADTDLYDAVKAAGIDVFAQCGQGRDAAIRLSYRDRYCR